jgi:hypothetical protein
MRPGRKPFRLFREHRQRQGNMDGREREGAESWSATSGQASSEQPGQTVTTDRAGPRGRSRPGRNGRGWSSGWSARWRTWSRRAWPAGPGNGEIQATRGRGGLSGRTSGIRRTAAKRPAWRDHARQSPPRRGGAYFAAMLERERADMARRLEEAAGEAEKTVVESLRSNAWPPPWARAPRGPGQGRRPGTGRTRRFGE